MLILKTTLSEYLNLHTKGNKMKFEELSQEQQEKAKACKTPEELLELAKEEGYELSENDLKAISGGTSWSCIPDCPEHIPCPQDR